MKKKKVLKPRLLILPFLLDLIVYFSNMVNQKQSFPMKPICFNIGMYMYFNLYVKSVSQTVLLVCTHCNYAISGTVGPSTSFSIVSINLYLLSTTSNNSFPFPFGGKTRSGANCEGMFNVTYGKELWWLMTVKRKEKKDIWEAHKTKKGGLVLKLFPPQMWVKCNKGIAQENIRIFFFLFFFKKEREEDQ